MKKVLFLFLFLLFAYPIFARLPVGKVLAEQIDINSAALSQLDELTGIGPVYAQRIIDGRPYSSVDDLLRVKGIGDVTLQKIKNQGLACVNCTSAQPIQANPNAQNPSPNQTPSSQATTTNTQNLTPVTYPTVVYINEILPNPEGEDSLEEWVELYNSNDSDVDLSGWQLQDRAGAITTHTIPPITRIMAGGFLVFKRPDTKIMLNNEGDEVNLLTPDGKIIDSIGFVSAPLGQSYNKTSSGWVWSIALTPGTKNIISPPQPKIASSGNTSKKAQALPSAQKNDNSEVAAAAALAGLSQSAEFGANPWLLFFIVLAITIILAAAVLLIKFKLSNERT